MWHCNSRVCWAESGCNCQLTERGGVQQVKMDKCRRQGWRSRGRKTVFLILGSVWEMDRRPGLLAGDYSRRGVAEELEEPVGQDSKQLCSEILLSSVMMCVVCDMSDVSECMCRVCVVYGTCTRVSRPVAGGGVCKCVCVMILSFWC